MKLTDSERMEMQQQPHREADLFFNVVAKRYERGSMGTLHLWQPARSPPKDRENLFKQSGPLRSPAANPPGCVRW